jgi:hypothetical protein
METHISLPLDSDGFLRRECPTCEREFKWLNSEEGDGEPAPDGGYYCPYCAVQSPESWLTKPQAELAENTVMRDVFGPQLDKMAGDLRRSSRGSFLKFDLKYDKPRALDPLVEDDDMRRVDFECHPAEPVKVVDDWDRDVHCLICGTPTAGAAD